MKTRANNLNPGRADLLAGLGLTLLLLGAPSLALAGGDNDSPYNMPNSGGGDDDDGTSESNSGPSGTGGLGGADFSGDVGVSGVLRAGQVPAGSARIVIQGVGQLPTDGNGPVDRPDSGSTAAQTVVVEERDDQTLLHGEFDITTRQSVILSTAETAGPRLLVMMFGDARADGPGLAGIDFVQVLPLQEGRDLDLTNLTRRLDQEPALQGKAVRMIMLKVTPISIAGSRGVTRQIEAEVFDRIGSGSRLHVDTVGGGGR